MFIPGGRGIKEPRISDRFVIHRMIQGGKKLLGRSMHGHGEAIGKPLEVVRMMLTPLLSNEVHVRLGACENGKGALFFEFAGQGEKVCSAGQVRKTNDRPSIPEVIIKGFLEDVLVIFSCDGHDGTVIGRVILNNACGQLGAEEAIAFTLNVAGYNGHPLSFHLEPPFSSITISLEIAANSS
jgi:hypothetical protein